MQAHEVAVATIVADPLRVEEPMNGVFMLLLRKVATRGIGMETRLVHTKTEEDSPSTAVRPNECLVTPTVRGCL